MFANRERSSPNQKLPIMKYSNFHFITIIGLLFSSFLCAQDITGIWHGKLTLPNGSLTIVFHINHAEQGNYVTTLDSPDQGVSNIKTATTCFQDSTLTIEIPIISASFKGKLNPDHTINGIFTQGLPLLLNLQKGEAYHRPQEPRPPFPYHTEEVSIKNEQDKITLAGTLTFPQKGNRFPAVILVTGSGPQNRNEETKGHKPFLVIADYLTRKGIAVLRCDDRGVAASQGNFASATNEDVAKDTKAALDYLRSRKEIDTRKIGIIGHSCGGTVSFITAAKNPAVAFIVSLAGAGVRGDSMMLKQVELIYQSTGNPDSVWQKKKPIYRHQYSTVLQQTDKTVEELQKELYADAIKLLSPEELQDLNVMRQLPTQLAAATSPWYLHFMRYDPTEALNKIKCPVLALNGDKDVQVDAAMNLNAIQQGIIKNGNKNVTVKIYPGLNHFFQTCQTCNHLEYGDLEETISQEVLKDITEWILNTVCKASPK